MKLVFLTNNPVSAPLMAWLEERTQLTSWQDKLTQPQLQALAPDLIVSYSYKHIIGAPLLGLYPDRFINLHISLLPYNRGADPNAWSFLEGTPKGVSIHLMDAGVDTGPLLAQEEVSFEEQSETLMHSYQTLQEHIQSLFRKHWDSIRNQGIAPQPQKGDGSFHKAGEFAAIKDRLLGAEGWDVPVNLLKERYRRLKESAA